MADDISTATMADLEFFIDGKNDPVARRRWPCIPRAGEQVFLQEVMSSVRVDTVFWGDAVGPDDRAVPDRLMIAIRCVTVDEEDHPGAEPKITVIDSAVVKKLLNARAALYEAKFAFEGMGDADLAAKEDIIRKIVDTLDTTRDEEVDKEGDLSKRVIELESEVLSLRGQLARVLAR